jgi:hypothetical protein
MGDFERFVDYRSIYSVALNLPSAAVKHGLGTENEVTLLAEIRAANVANQATTQAILNAVVNARDRGQSWSEIGRALGVTKQGAQKRYVEPDEDALVRAIVETRSVESFVRVPKPIAMLLPAFEWIRKAIDANQFGEASLRIHEDEEYVDVPRDEYLRRHPTAIAARFFLQQLTELPVRDIDATFYFETEEEAKAKADESWGPGRWNEGQEIIDSDTGVRWIRTDGSPAWEESAPVDDLGAHSRRRGHFVMAVRCDGCGEAMTVVEKDEYGRLWSRCPNGLSAP